MDRAIALLNIELKVKSPSKIAKELKISKATISLVISGKYPNPNNIYLKIIDLYGDGPVEIVGVDTTQTAVEIFKELEEWK